MIDHVVEAKVAAVAVFRRGQQLEVVGKHHPCGTCCVQDLVLSHANAKLRLPEWFELCLFAQFYIDCHGIALLVSVNLSMLVVLHDVHLSGIFGRDVLRGKIVATAKHVETADVEVRDVLAHVADGTIIRDADARQILQSVFERHIAFFEEGCEVVGERVAPLSQRVGLHRHLLQRYAFGCQNHVHFRHSLFQRQLLGLLLIADMIELQRHHSRRHTLNLQHILALRIRAGERQRLRAAHQFHNHIAHGLKPPSSSPRRGGESRHPPRHPYLCRGRHSQQ